MEQRTRFNVGLPAVRAARHAHRCSSGGSRRRPSRSCPTASSRSCSPRTRSPRWWCPDQRITGKLKAPENGKTVAVANLVPPDARRAAVEVRRQVHAGPREHPPARHPLLGGAGAGVLRRLDLLVRRMASKQGRRPRRLHEHRQEPGQGLRRDATPASPSTTSPASTRPRTSCRRSSTSSRTRSSYGRLGARMPKGVLLVGPPGTGKTLLAARSPARPACRSSRSPAPSSSRCSSASARRGCATSSSRRASKAPAIIFIDELDALGRARGAGGYVGGHDEKEQTLNQLLVELDGFDPEHRPGAARRDQPARDPRPGAAARRPLRPPGAGRPAGQEGPRRRSCRCTREKVKLAPDVDLEKVAALTPGFTGADLANLVNEAALLATRRGADAVTHGRLQRRDRAHRRRAGEAQPPAQPDRSASRRVPRDGPRAGRAGAARQRPGAQGLDHPARRRRARLHASSARPRTAS